MPEFVIPLWFKLAYTGFVLYVMAVWWKHYGWTNFLWFSDIAFIGAVPAMWLESAALGAPRRRQPVAAVSLVQKALDMLEPAARQKHQSLSLRVEHDPLSERRLHADHRSARLRRQPDDELRRIGDGEQFRGHDGTDGESDGAAEFGGAFGNRAGDGRRQR